MNHHWSIHGIFVVVRPTILEIESLRKLEVQLYRSTLVRSFESILNGDIDLGTIERAVTRVELPFPRLEALKGVLQLLSGMKSPSTI